MSDDIRIKAPTKEQLEKLYIEDNLTRKEVAEKLGVSTPTVSRYLYCYGIKKRVILTEEELEKLYIEDNLTRKEVAEKLGVSESTITRYVKSYGIEKRVKREIPTKEQLERLCIEDDLTRKEIAEKIGIGLKALRKYIRLYGIQKPNKIPSEEELRRLYIEEDLLQREVAERIGVPQSTITSYLRRYSIRKRPKIKKELKSKYDEILAQCIENIPTIDTEKCIITCYPILESCKELVKELDLSDNIYKRCQHIIKDAIEKGWFRELFGKDRIGMAGAVAYLAGFLEKDRRTQAEIAEVIKRSSATIRKDYQLILSHYIGEEGIEVD